MGEADGEAAGEATGDGAGDGGAEVAATGFVVGDAAGVEGWHAMRSGKHESTATITDRRHARRLPTTDSNNLSSCIA
jgi:hypothetical protein